MLLCCSVTHSPSSGPNTSFVSKRTIFITLQCTDLSCFSSPNHHHQSALLSPAFFLLSLFFFLFSHSGQGGEGWGGISQEALQGSWKR